MQVRREEREEREPVGQTSVQPRRSQILSSTIYLVVYTYGPKYLFTCHRDDICKSIPPN